MKAINLYFTFSPAQTCFSLDFSDNSIEQQVQVILSQNQVCDITNTKLLLLQNGKAFERTSCIKKIYMYKKQLGVKVFLQCQSWSHIEGLHNPANGYCNDECWFFRPMATEVCRS